MRIGVLVNPAAGRGRAARAGIEVEHLLGGTGHAVVDLTAPDATSARIRAAAFLIEPEVDALVAVGGDGVVNMAANALLTHAPHVPLGIVPAGTGNDFSRLIGLPRGDVAAATGRVIEALDAGSRRQVDAVRVTPAGEGTTARQRWFVNVASAGIDAAVNARANHIRWPKGEARYVAALLRELVGFRGYAVAVVADGVRLGESGTIVAVANARYMGGGMLVAPDAEVDDGLLDVVTAPTIPRRTLLRIFPRVYRGTHVTHPLVTVTRACEVLLLPADGGDADGADVGDGSADAALARRAPAPLVHADGEPLGRLPLRLEVVPGALTLLG